MYTTMAVISVTIQRFKPWVKARNSLLGWSSLVDTIVESNWGGRVNWLFLFKNRILNVDIFVMTVGIYHFHAKKYFLCTIKHCTVHSRCGNSRKTMVPAIAHQASFFPHTTSTLSPMHRSWDGRLGMLACSWGGSGLESRHSRRGVAENNRI